MIERRSMKLARLGSQGTPATHSSIPGTTHGNCPRRQDRSKARQTYKLDAPVHKHSHLGQHETRKQRAAKISKTVCGLKRLANRARVNTPELSSRTPDTFTCASETNVLLLAALQECIVIAKRNIKLTRLRSQHITATHSPTLRMQLLQPGWRQLGPNAWQKVGKRLSNG